MTKKIHFSLASSLIAGAFLVSPTISASQLVSDDLLTGSNLTTAWQACGADSAGIDVSNLDAGGCAFRTTPVEPGVTYRLSCGMRVEKYGSITLAFLDANDNELAKETTEIFEHVSGAYSATLAAPAGTTTAALGIYGEAGSGVQDCVLVNTTTAPEPTKGSISGLTWFDLNANNTVDPTENVITGTPVTLTFNGAVLNQTVTDANGNFYFGGLDIDSCYKVVFGVADATLELADAGSTNADICLSDITADVTNISTAYVSVAPPTPPADYAICGVAWVDANGNGMFDGSDTTLPNVEVSLVNSATGDSATVNTNNNGNYVFSDLTAGGYVGVFTIPDGHEPTVSAGAPAAGKSVIGVTGETSVITLPADSNTVVDSACTVQDVNAGFAVLPTVLPPTVAMDDAVSGVFGQSFSIDFLTNDAPCNGVVNELSILGHNIPGTLNYNETTKQIDVSNTTAAGTYSLSYGIRGECGSFDTAEIIVTLTEPVVVVPNAPDAPICRVETGGSYRYGGVDVFTQSVATVATEYRFYSRDNSLLQTLFGSDFSHQYLVRNNASAATIPFVDNWETEWVGSEYGFDQLAVYSVTAVVNGIESQPTLCIRDLISPIALDLNNHGRIERVAGEFNVDLNNDGIDEALSQWFAPSAGILVTADAKGQITGEQLFGNVPGLYSDGYAELALRDLNDDGQLTQKELMGLAIWNDLNSDTMVDTGELSTLEDHLIDSLAVEHYKFMARARKSNGKSILMEDVWLPYAPMAALSK